MALCMTRIELVIKAGPFEDLSLEDFEATVSNIWRVADASRAFRGVRERSSSKRTDSV